MKPKQIDQALLSKLGFPKPLDYDVKPNGDLVIIDRNGSKFTFCYADYASLLPSPRGSSAKPPR